MKLAAEADGPERQRWISAALAWSELSHLRGAAEHNVPEGWPTRQLVTGARHNAASDPPSARIAFRAKCDAAPVYDLKSSLMRPEPRAGQASWVLGRRPSAALFAPGGRAAALGPGRPAATPGTTVSRQASPGPEKIDPSGVVRGVGSGRSVVPDRAVPPLESYRLARSSRRRRVKGSAVAAMARTCCARQTSARPGCPVRGAEWTRLLKSEFPLCTLTFDSQSHR
jgi:hypothetical protein